MPVDAPPLISAELFAVAHGFTTRHGGVSKGHYASLNLGLSTGDDERCVWENRRRVLSRFGLGLNDVCALAQVHGARVVKASAGWHEHKADGVVTADRGLALVVATADCVPILFWDPARGAIGAAHAGWRGTLDKVALAVLAAMSAWFGSRAQDIRAAIGPCISQRNYRVGDEVQNAFVAQGFSQTLFACGDKGRPHLDLVEANRSLLVAAGVAPDNVWTARRCTYEESETFYSHRRDGSNRGSHWALTALL